MNEYEPTFDFNGEAHNKAVKDLIDEISQDETLDGEVQHTPILIPVIRNVHPVSLFQQMDNEEAYDRAMAPIDEPVLKMIPDEKRIEYPSLNEICDQIVNGPKTTTGFTTTGITTTYRTFTPLEMDIYKTL